MTTLDDFFGIDESEKCYSCGTTDNMSASQAMDAQTEKPLYHICQECAAKIEAQKDAERKAEEERMARILWISATGG